MAVCGQHVMSMLVEIWARAPESHGFCVFYMWDVKSKSQDTLIVQCIIYGSGT